MTIPKRKNRKPVRNLKRMDGIEENAISDALKSGVCRVKSFTIQKQQHHESIN